MKDLTHYFADTTKSSDSSPSDIKDNQQQYRGSSPKKRKRVKIKISRTNSKSRVCDIVESKNDLVDKTPSPFTRAGGGEKPSPDLPKETSKTSPHLQLVECDVAEEQEDTTARDLKGRKKLNRKKIHRNEKNSLRNTADDDCVYIGIKKNVSLLDDDDVKKVKPSEREESNAFQVLMNSSKPIQNTPPQNVSQEKIIGGTTEDRDKLKKNREKLLIMADKKGYTKRKLAEIEEGEKIEKKIENRMKLFKTDTKVDQDLEICNGGQKQLSGNLFNYFSKTTMNCKQKDITNVSTIVVKADVHMPDDAIKNCFYKGTLQSDKKKFKKSHKKLTVADDMPPEDLALINDLEEKQVTTRTPKPRWSMRIKFHPSKDEEISGATSDEEIFSPRSQAKFKRLSLKTDKNSDDIFIIDAESELKVGKAKERRDNSKCRRSVKPELSAEKLNGNSSLENERQHLIDQIDLDIEEVEEIDKCNSTIPNVQVSFPDKRKDSVIDVDSDGSIVLSDRSENSESNAALKKNVTEKLAPLFTKKLKPDQAVIAARRLFLQSDSTGENPKKTEKKDKNTGPSFLPFPLISHINRHDNHSCDKLDDIKLSLRREIRYTPSVGVRNFKHVLDLQHSSTATVKSAKKLVRANAEDVLTDIETRCTDARRIWAHVSSVAQGQTISKVKNPSPEGKGKSRRSTKKRETPLETKDKKNQAAYDTWTYKYKPLSTQDVAGNEEAAAKLKLWLDGWRSTLRDDANSENEFYSSDCSYSSNNENNQVAVLIGPHGVGKSASVYAVAEELGYSVLEVNASSKRPGKKILKELEEATKSHRIKEDKMKTAFFSISKREADNKIPQKTLILLEDIDLIFEEDEGFVGATYQLASNTKRPIVMTCRDVCPYLTKMAPLQNKIYFQSVEGTRMWAFLELISLAETGYRLPYGYITDLLQSGDLRRALLQLQFLLLSGPVHTSKHHVSFSNNFWQDMRYYMYNPAIKVTKKQVTKKNQKRNKTRNKSEDALYDLAHKLDVISVLTSLIDVNDLALDLSNIRIRASLSLTEDVSPYCVTKCISSDIGNWLRDKAVCSEPITNDEKHAKSNILLRKQLNTGVDFALSSVTQSVLDRRAMSVDYLPSVRTICRSEELRLAMNSKRGNRFFHYLHGLKLPATSTKPNILSAACKMMQEKIEKV